MSMKKTKGKQNIKQKADGEREGGYLWHCQTQEKKHTTEWWEWEIEIINRHNCEDISEVEDKWKTII